MAASCATLRNVTGIVEEKDASEASGKFAKSTPAFMSLRRRFFLPRWAQLKTTISKANIICRISSPSVSLRGKRSRPCKWTMPAR